MVDSLVLFQRHSTVCIRAVSVVIVLNCALPPLSVMQRLPNQADLSPRVLWTKTCVTRMGSARCRMQRLYDLHTPFLQILCTYRSPDLNSKPTSVYKLSHIAHLSWVAYWNKCWSPWAISLAPIELASKIKSVSRAGVITVKNITNVVCKEPLVCCPSPL